MEASRIIPDGTAHSEAVGLLIRRGSIPADGLTLADINEALRYARTVQPSTPPPSFPATRFHVSFAAHLHRVPNDVFDATLAIHDDLQWEQIRTYHEGTYDEFRTVKLKVGHCELTLYTVRGRREPSPVTVLPGRCIVCQDPVGIGCCEHGRVSA